MREAEDKLSKFKYSYTETLEDTSAKYNQELSKDRDKIESVCRENDQLKTFLGDMRSANDYGAKIGNALDSQVSRLEGQTTDLRRDIFQQPSPY